MAEPIKFESALPALLMQLLGTKGTASQSQTQATTADTAGLQQILGQQLASSTPAGMEALLKELFTTGAQQVPVLTQAYANATGTRSSNNSGLQLSLNDLNKTLAGQAAALVGQQQQQAAATAAKLADATKQVTSNTTTTQKQAAGNPKAAGGLALAGTALNQLDKLGLTKYLKGQLGTNTAAVADPLGDFINTLGVSGSAAGLGSGVGDSAAGLTSYLFGNGGSDASLAALGSVSSEAAGLGGFGDYFFGSGGSDGALGDLGSFISSGADNVVSGIGDSLSGAGDWISSGLGEVGDWLSGFFADGGMIGQQPPGYADGGVVRNKNNMGALPTRQGTSALTVQLPVATAPATNVQAKPMPVQQAPLPRPRQPTLEELLAADSGSGNASSVAGVTGTPAQNAAMVNGFFGSALGVVGGPVGALAAQALGLGTVPGQMAQTVRDAISEALGLGSSTSMSSSTAAGVSNAVAADTAMAEDAAFSNASTGGNGGSDAGSYGGDADFGNMGGGFGDHSGGDYGGGDSGGSDSGGNGSGDAGSSADGSYANGGLITGPGTGISDSVSATLTDHLGNKKGNVAVSTNEYVLSADVTDLLGRDFLDSLQAKFHKPAAVQRAQGVR